ncbi:hypothetical protein [Paraburkholderia panacisoli]|jgi:protein ImuB|uniref:hypothetical protein n=1 Tax=Paraburkholderia panacisoli TaxID=2603818 RepID=UPI003CCC7797
MICEPLLPANAQTINRRQWLQEIGLSIDIFKRRGAPLNLFASFFLYKASCCRRTESAAIKDQSSNMLWIAVTLPRLSLEAVKPLTPLPDGSLAKPNRREPSDRASLSQSAGDINERRCYGLAGHADILIPVLDALRAGVQAGRLRSCALALAPGLKLLAADATRETQASEAIALALLTHARKYRLPTRISCCWKSVPA